MIVGYTMLGQDNDAYFIPEGESVDVPTCPKCGYLLDFINFFNPFFKVKRKNYDVSFTYDLRCIVSLKFKEFCLRERYGNVSFKEFELEPNFFQFQPSKTVTFDIEKKQIELIGFCEICRNYREVVGAIPPSLSNINGPLNDGFYRTDLLFGWENGKQPLILIGVETYEKLKREKFKGLIFEPILT